MITLHILNPKFLVHGRWVLWGRNMFYNLEAAPAGSCGLGFEVVCGERQGSLRGANCMQCPWQRGLSRVPGQKDVDMLEWAREGCGGGS